MKSVWRWIKNVAIEIIGHLILIICGHAKVDEPEQRCRECGCTDLNACVDLLGRPCHWVEEDLCSSCAPFVKVVHLPWHPNPLLEHLLNMSDEERKAVKYGGGECN